MAISRLITCGFEQDYRANSHPFNLKWSDGVVAYHSSTYSYDLPYSGSYSCRIQSSQYIRFTWPTAKTQLQVSYMLHTDFAPINVSSGAALFTLSDSISANYLGASLNIVGDDMVCRTNGTTRDTLTDGVDKLQVGRWLHVAADIKFHTTTGWFYVWLDGVEVLNYSGQTDHLISDASSLWISGYPSSPSWGSGAWWRAIDNLYVNDSEGEGAAAEPDNAFFYFVRPNGNGNYTQWTGSDSDTTDNYLHVDEPSGTKADNSTGCIDTDTATNKDSWTMEDPNLPADVTIDAVIPSLMIQNGGFGQDTVKLLTRYSATDSLSAALTTPITWGALQDRQTTKPGGGAWDETSVNGMEVGVEMQ